MFTNFHQLIRCRPVPDDYDFAFVKEVSVRVKSVPNPRFERWLLLGWVLVAGKCWLVTWLIEKYRVPIDPLWVIGPTVLFALLCTMIFFRRE